jgi:hypothetical protein
MRPECAKCVLRDQCDYYAATNTSEEQPW